MRSRSAPFGRRRRLVTVQVLPTLVTAGNLLAGVLAVSYLLDAAGTADAARQEVLWVKAAWMIFLGMFCDALDGRIARLTRTSSAFGTQLDSLADVVTFGVAPALLAKSIVVVEVPGLLPRVVVALVALYTLGAALRLARYNVESMRTAAEGSSHVTMVFRGLPSPAAAGVLASLVLLHHEIGVSGFGWIVLASAPALGVLMISRLPYLHVLNRWLHGSRPILTVVLVVITGLLVTLHFHETVAGVFVLYAVSGVVIYVTGRWFGRPRWAIAEEEDEEEAPRPAEEEGATEDAPPAKYLP